jgi:membrane metallo-endopeptidase-like protein 1
MFFLPAQIVEVSDTPLLSVIEKLGGWPVTDSAWDQNKVIDLEILLAVIKRNFTLGVLVEEWVGPDDRDSREHIIQVHVFKIRRHWKIYYH